MRGAGPEGAHPPLVVHVPRMLRTQCALGRLSAADLTLTLSRVRALVAYLDAHRDTFFVADYDNVDPAYFRLAQVV